MNQNQDQFSSRWGILLAAIGMAVGTGNIWRFPRVAAANGGGSFLIAWLVFMFAWSVPLVIAEFAMGKRTRRGPAGAIGHLVGARWNWLGAFVGVCSCFIMFYYSVVAGWCLKYFVASLGGGLTGIDSQAYWASFTGGNLEPVLYHLVAMALGCAIISRGVVRGIELTNRVLIPVLFLLLVIGAARALMLPGAVQGLAFLFTPDWDRLLHHQVWLEALSQSAWSVGAAWGLVMTYGVYLRKKDDVVLTSYATAFGDYSASLLAGIAVLCTVFAVLPPDQALAALGAGNEGLTFIWLPRLFEQLPLGGLFLSLFFLALSFAALSSLIAMIELATRIGVDLGFERRRAVLVVGLVGFALGLPSAWKLGFFQNQDWVWGLGLMVSGLFMAVAVALFGTERFRTEVVNDEDERSPVGRWFTIVMRYVVPLEFVALMAWWFYQSATVYDREGWWNPLHTYSVGTTLAQWVLVIGVLIALNRWWAARVGAGEAGR
ncbi:MAG: sodium-dependent transporter [Vicinamibacteria bacterium]|nr:sodium-dependent transporter [Vicinamibacteria bacterium]